MTRNKVFIFLLFSALFLLISLTASNLPGDFIFAQQPSGAPVKKPDVPQIELPAMPGESKFLGYLKKENAPAAAPPAAPQLLRWNFSVKKTYVYDFLVKMEGSQAMTGFPNEVKMFADGAGALLVKSRGNRTAELMLRNFKVKTKITGAPENMGKDEENEDEVKEESLAEGFNEDGSLKEAGSIESVLLKALLPLPPAPCKVGESVSMPIEIPFGSEGLTLKISGTITITLERYITINGRLCAQLSSQILINKTNIPFFIPGDYRVLVKGSSLLYFDIRDRCFVSGAIALLMSLRVDMPNPQKLAADSAKSAELPDRIRMYMDMDNLVSIRRNPAKER